MISFSFQYTLGDKLQQHCEATRRSNKSLLVYWRIFVKIFVAVTEFCCRNKSHNFSLIWFFATCCSDKIPLQRQRFSQKFSSTHEAICRSDVSPHRVAATCRLVCTDLYWLIDKFENMNTWSVDFWLTASEAICCISGSRHKVLNWNATILFSLICCKMALFSSSSFVNSSIPAGGFLREFVNDFWL